MSKKNHFPAVPFQLLTRDGFRKAVFERDGHKCVICKAPGQDSHHVLERRLWTDGGYYLENGATLCGPCHLHAESTQVSCEQIRELAGIEKFPIPEHLYQDQKYDKWANVLLPNGHRLCGELYHDESVQRILAPVLHMFLPWVKYPRTYHLPWSHGRTKDDRTLEDASHFEEQEVVVTVKMDGEQTTMYAGYIHARSVDFKGHPSRSRVRALHGRVGYNIPKGWRVCGENLYAKHSIHYKHLPEYFLAFSVWNERNICLSWDETLEWTELLELTPVPVLYRGVWDEELVRGLYREEYDGDPMEGYVVRLADQFHYRDFPWAMAKFVRADHVRTHGGWMRHAVTPNLLEAQGNERGKNCGGA
jgi:hypothetical protein